MVDARVRASKGGQGPGGTCAGVSPLGPSESTMPSAGGDGVTAGDGMHSGEPRHCRRLILFLWREAGLAASWRVASGAKA